MERFFEAGATGIYFYIGLSIAGLVIMAIFLARLLRHADKKPEGSNLMFSYPYEKEWHRTTEAPCPGSLIACEDGHRRLFIGYAVARDGRPALLHLPSYITDFRTPPAVITPETLQPIPLALLQRWQYIERRILPTETLATYYEQYRRT